MGRLIIGHLQMNKNILSLYFIVGTQDIHLPKTERKQGLLEVLSQACDEQITCFQFREKGSHALQSKQEIYALAKQCQQICRDKKVAFVVDDDVDLALQLHADGIHVGQSDLAIHQVLQRCSGKMFIGLSINNFAQAQCAEQITGIDYYGVGPIFATTSKPDAQPVVGHGLLSAIRNAKIATPIVGIGGINQNNADSVRQAGADGIAVISAITHACMQEPKIRSQIFAQLKAK